MRFQKRLKPPRQDHFVQRGIKAVGDSIVGKSKHATGMAVFEALHGSVVLPACVLTPHSGQVAEIDRFREPSSQLDRHPGHLLPLSAAGGGVITTHLELSMSWFAAAILSRVS